MKAKQSILRAAERLADAPIRDAVLVILRRQWAYVVAAVAFGVGLAISKSQGLPPPLDFAIAGFSAGVGLQSGMTPRFLARTEQGLLLMSSYRLIGRPRTLIGAVDANTVIIKTGAINRKVSIGGESYVVSRLFESRFRALLEGLQGVPPPDVPPGYVPYR